MLREFAQAIRIGVNRSLPLRHVRNVWRFPGLGMDPSVNHSIQGDFAYGKSVGIGEGANLIVQNGSILRLGNLCYVGRYVELSPLGLIDIGDQASLQDRCVLVGDVLIGRYCLLSLNVLMTSGTHYFDMWPNRLIKDQDLMVSYDIAQSSKHSRPIEVGEDCWLGVNSVVMPGVTIGRGCVVGSNSVVTHDLSPYSVVAGSPARLIRARLAFIPPRKVHWKNGEDLPYFYSGFEVSKKELEQNRPLGGLVARNRCALWVDRTGATEITVHARSATSAEVVMKCAGVVESVGQDWRAYRFPVDVGQGPIWIDVVGEAVVICEASVE